MDMKRRKQIEDLLRRGGAIQKQAENHSMAHPDGGIKLKKEEVMELLDEGQLVVVNCGCTGFWWALRPDLIAIRSGSR